MSAACLCSLVLLAPACANPDNNSDRIADLQRQVDSLKDKSVATSITATASTATATRTPEPTVVTTAPVPVVATPIPTTNFTPTERAYCDHIGTESSFIAPAVSSYHQMMASPKISDPTWKSGIAQALATWHVIYDEAKTLIPPPAFKAFHGQYLSGLALLDAATDQVVQAIRRDDPAALARANSQIDAANRSIGAALELLPAQ